MTYRNRVLNPNFLTLTKLYDGVANLPLMNLKHRRNLAKYLRLLHDNGEVVHTFRDSDNYIWVVHRTPRLDDIFMSNVHTVDNVSLLQ